MQRYIIGRVLISKERPATASEFWVAIMEPEEIEVGTYIVVDDPQGKILGIIEDIEYITQASAEDSYTQTTIELRQGIKPSTQPLVYNMLRLRS